MSYIPSTPVITVGPENEQPADGTEALPDVQTNWAQNPDVVQMVQTDIIPIVNWCRSQRLNQEEEWRAIRRMLLLEHDDGQKYRGRSNAYMPMHSRNMKTLVSKVSRGLFPSDDYMDVIPRQDGMEEQAKSVKSYLQYEFDKVCRLRLTLKPFLREFFNFGIAVGKFWYEPREMVQRRVGKRKQVSLNNIRGLMEHEEISYENDYALEGFRFSTRSIFNWYIYPVTAASLEEAVLTAEDIFVGRAFIQEAVRKGEWIDVKPEDLGTGGEGAEQNAQDQLQSQMGNSMMPNLGGNPTGDQRCITEIWVNLKLPSAAYSQGEDKECEVPCKVVISGNLVLAVRRNPFWHQRCPYVVARDEVLPGSFYSKGTGHVSRAIQYLVNDFTNQLNDNGTYAMNPVAIVQPGLLAGPIPAMKPGAVWPVTDPQAIRFERPPIEQVQYGIQLVQYYMSAGQDASGAPAVMQGNSSRGAAKTATGTQILQANANNPIQDIVEDIEQSVMTALMYGCWMLGQQFRRGDVMDTIAGARIKIPKQNLFGDFDFSWLASSQAVNQQQRAQQSMQLLQVITNPVIMQLLQMQGRMVDPTPLIRKIYCDGFGFRGFDQVIKQIQMQPGMPGAMPGQETQQDPTQESNIRSAAVQGGSEMEMQPGEGQEFANVRDEADEMAAMMGAMQNGGG